MGRWAFALALLALPAWGDDGVRSGGQGVTLVATGGAEVVLRPNGDEVLLLHFFATWCPTCAEDLDHLQDAAAECPGSPLRVFAVNVAEDEDQVSDFMQRNRLELAVLRDPEGKAWRQSDGRGLPANLFWSRTRKWTEVGPKSADDWREAVSRVGCEPRSGTPENASDN